MFLPNAAPVISFDRQPGEWCSRESAYSYTDGRSKINRRLTRLLASVNETCDVVSPISERRISGQELGREGANGNDMRIGIIGSGRIGTVVAEHLVGLGHSVTISNSRGPESLIDLVTELGPNAEAGTVEEAAAFGPLVFEAIPFGEYETLPADALVGTTVISAANYYPDRDGDIDLGGRAQTELVAEHLSDATVVKAFNTMYYEILRDEARPDAPLEERLTLFLAGDDEAAKETVADLIEAIGFAPLDVGSLAESTVMEPGSPIYNESLRLANAKAELNALQG